MFESPLKFVARNVNWSSPANPVAGVYWTVPFVWSTGPSVPCAGADTIERLSIVPSQGSGTDAAVSCAVLTSASEQTESAGGPVRSLLSIAS